MAILAGIDEAGYGPLLGPLVVCGVVFRLPDDYLREDHWDLLGSAVSKSRKSSRGRLVIADSKKVYSRSSGIYHLRRSVLGALQTLSRCHPDGIKRAGELLELVAGECSVRLKEYPWYSKLHEQVLGHDEDDVSICASGLRSALSRRQMEIPDINCRIMDVSFYNGMIRAVKNKSSVLFTAVSTLIDRVIGGDYCPADNHNINIVVDRQGGRLNYIRQLRSSFPSFDLSVLKQNQSVSSYQLCGRSKRVRIHFVTKADEKFLAAGLASMTSKYIRELLMGQINEHFLAHCGVIRPTAGYWTDGKRFIKDINAHIPHVKYDKDALIRLR